MRRRTHVVGHLPQWQRSTALRGVVLVAHHEEWAVGRLYLSSEPLATVVGDGNPSAGEQTKEV